MITKEELSVRIKNACAEVIAAEAELTEIDSRFGDADHGFTMAKIAKTISEAIEEGDSIQEMLDNAGCAVMVLNGGSAVPLWNTWLDGLQEHSEAADTMTVEQVKAMFQGAYELKRMGNSLPCSTVCRMRHLSNGQPDANRESCRAWRIR